MPRYIDADSLKLSLENLPQWGGEVLLISVITALHRTPTADVAQRAEVAREIFREIREKGGFSDPCVLHIVLSFEELDEIEKKYTGGDDHMEKEKT